MTTTILRLDVKSRKETKSENIRNQIVELAGKSSALEEKIQANSNRSQNNIKENLSPNSKRSETNLGFCEDRKQLTPYPLLNRKKDYINLNFTSIKKETKDEDKPWRVPKHEDILAKEKPSTILLNRLKSKVGSPIYHNNINKHEEANDQCKIDAEVHNYEYAPSPKREMTLHPKNKHLRQISSSALGHNYVPDLNYNEGGKGNFNRSHIKSRDSKQNKKDALERCEVKGNAVPTPPQHNYPGYTLSSKRVGLFTASLAAFKRRLRVSSKKHIARLHDDCSTKDEEYLITVDNENMDTGQVEAPRQSIITIQDHPFTKSSGASLHIPNARQTLDVSKTPVLQSTLKVIKALPNRYSLEKGLSNSSKSANENDANVNNNNKVLDEHLVNFQEQLPSVTHARTYVLETDQASMVKSEIPDPIPLTVHNLRLHDSLLNMHARRARRLERCRRMNRNVTNPEASRLCDYAIPKERIHKWLQNVVIPERTEPETFESSNKSEFVLMQQCSTENGFDFQQAHQTVILV